MDAERFIGDGEGETRSAKRRSFSRPPGVLSKTSCGDLGGHSGILALILSKAYLQFLETTHLATC